MSREGHIYKLCCDGVDEFYIGSSFDMEDRKRTHKTKCNNPNSNRYNLKVYQYIRANGGYDNWKYEILVEKEFENKRELENKEQECIKLLNPSLNSNNAYRTEEDMKLQRKALNKVSNDKRRQTKINCICGGKTDKYHKANHEKSNKHQKYITNNITYNITNLTINN